jgi:hypothetical protein
MLAGGTTCPFGMTFVTDVLRGHFGAAWPHTPAFAVVACVAVVYLIAGGPATAAWTVVSRRRGLPGDPVAALAHNPAMRTLARNHIAQRAVRPRGSLAGTSAHDAGPGEIGLELGNLMRPGQQQSGSAVFAAWEDTLVAFMAPRSGKTTGRGRGIREPASTRSLYSGRRSRYIGGIARSPDNSGDSGHPSGHDGRVTDNAARIQLASIADAIAGREVTGLAHVVERLSELSGPQWLHLDQAARRGCYRSGSPLDQVATWSRLLADAETGPSTLVAAVAASMTRDGRVREAAVAVLSGLPSPVASAALAVRADDWVTQVRSAAWAAVRARTSGADAAAIAPVMLALRNRWRGNRSAPTYLAAIADGPSAPLSTMADSAADSACRLWALGVLADRGLLAVGPLLDRALGDRDLVVAVWCARRLAGQPGSVPPEAWEQLLSCARAGVRAVALECVPEEQLSRERLRGLLLDGSGAVRAVARWKWKRRGDDPAPVYREALQHDLMPRQVTAALDGLAEDHDSSLPEVAGLFLTHRSPRVQCAAARAYAPHAAIDDVITHLTPLLFADSAKVAATALTYLAGPGLPASTLEALDAAGTPRSRRIALAIRQRQGTWHRVHADLVAINGPDPSLASHARDDLLNWLGNGAARAYGRPVHQQAAEIAALLATASGLTDAHRREVAFVAGIRSAS